MVVAFYVILYVAVHITFQKLIGKSYNRLALILARDSGAMGVVSLVAYYAGTANYHQHYTFLLQLGIYFLVLSLISFIVVKRERNTSQLTEE